jgi:hypothetical protein
MRTPKSSGRLDPTVIRTAVVSSLGDRSHTLTASDKNRLQAGVLVLRRWSKDNDEICVPVSKSAGSGFRNKLY